MYGVVVSKNPQPPQPGPAERIAAITDPLQRAAAAQEFLVNGRRTLRTVQTIRDDAIREAREAMPGTTIYEIARAIPCRPNVVVDALRTPRETRNA